jgi:hypothetical protein
MKNDKTKSKNSKRGDLDLDSEKRTSSPLLPPKMRFKKRIPRNNLRRSGRIQKREENKDRGENIVKKTVKKRQRREKEREEEEEQEEEKEEEKEEKEKVEEEEKEQEQGKFYPLKNSETLKNSREEIDWNEWNTATGIRNYLMDDGFLDVLQNKSSSSLKSDPKYSREIGKMISSSNSNKSFVANLMSYGKTFEKKVIDLLTKDLGINNTINIQGDIDPRSCIKYKETISAIKKGIPIIFQGILRNYKNKTHGVADILIRSDWINRFLDFNALSQEEASLKAPYLNGDYHYVVIDVKYKTLPLRADGKHLRNDTNMKAYKGQLWIYNTCLLEVQGYIPPYAFILGSKWKYTTVGNTYQGNSCFGRLGRIDYLNLDNGYIGKVENALTWLKDVRENDYDMTSYPLARDELYPNMSNRHDYPYRDIKKKYAEEHSDLTLLWYVGPKQRRIANSQGIYTWKDPRCTPETLGIYGKKRSKILSGILEANRSETRTIYPKYILNNYGDWKNRSGRKIDLFVDFETSCSIFNDLDELPMNNGNSLIFLIGAGYIHPDTKQWIFKTFIVSRINENEEIRICREFVEFVNSLAREFRITSAIPCWCFSHAEKSAWNRFQDRCDCSYQIEWADMLKIFYNEPISLHGALSYSLKTLCVAFHSHGFIQTTYPPDSGCANGSEAAFLSRKIDLECEKANISFQDHPTTKEIVQYNEIDVKVMQEILFYFREHHLDLSLKDAADDDEDIEDDECEIIEEPTKRLKRSKNSDDDSYEP